MRSLVTVILGLVLSAAGQAPAAPALPAANTAFKTVHLFNLPAGGEPQLLADLHQMNQSIAKAGHPEIRYRIWKAQGTRQGAHTYLWESTWPNRAIYDDVHKHPEYEAAVKRISPSIDKALLDHLYNQYVELSVAAPPAP